MSAQVNFIGIRIEQDRFQIERNGLLQAVGRILAPGNLDAQYACGCKVAIRRGSVTTIQPCGDVHECACGNTWPVKVAA